jgi:DNA-binding transcriptional MerR regulator
MTDSHHPAPVRLGEAARRGGVTPGQLHYYIMVGLVTPSETSTGGQRLFDDRTIQRIRMIKLLNDSGYPLRAIRDIFFGAR